MSQEYCKACAPCNERNYDHCDNCTASCCQDNMKNKYNEMQNLEYSLNNQMYQNKTNFEKEKINISHHFEMKLMELNDSCEEKKREITDTKGKRNKDIEKNLTKKEKTKKNLKIKKKI